jgi:hypothetical protein
VRWAELVFEQLDLGDEIVDSLADVLTPLVQLQELAVEQAQALVAVFQQSTQAEVFPDRLAVALYQGDHDPFETIEVGFRSRLAERGR